VESFLRYSVGAKKNGKSQKRKMSVMPAKSPSFAAMLRAVQPDDEPLSPLRRVADAPDTSPSKRAQHSGEEGSTHPIPGITGLENCTVVHRVGNPTEEIALRQLPLKLMDVALVFADVDLTHHGPLRSHGGTELQIQDSEAITSTLLLREMHAQAHATARRHGKPGCPPLTIVTQVVDVLTQRLFEMEPGLLEPKSARATHAPTAPADGDEAYHEEPPVVESILMQRNQLETATLTVAAMRGASWSAIRRLLDADSGTDVTAFYAHQCLTEEELIADGHSSPPPAGLESRRLSFWDVTARVRSLGLGTLIGWRRPADDPEQRSKTHDMVVNPLDKNEKLLWRGSHQFILLKRSNNAEEHSTMSRESVHDMYASGQV